jgi:hypothetical protein
MDISSVKFVYGGVFMKVNKRKIIMVLFSLSILIGTVIGFKVYYEPLDLPYSQEYVVGQGNIIGDVDTSYFSSKGKEFEIGANKHGYAVFKNPTEALKKLKSDYKDGLSLIQKEFKLAPINKLNYKSYKTYGWQVTTGSEEEKEQARFVTSFMDIYENSFNK